MKSVPLKELSDDVRQLLIDAEQAGGLVLEDENGRARSRIYAYREPTEAQRQAALERLSGFQQKVRRSFDEQGISEDHLDRLIQDDR